MPLLRLHRTTPPRRPCRPSMTGSSCHPPLLLTEAMTPYPVGLAQDWAYADNALAGVRKVNREIQVSPRGRGAGQRPGGGPGPDRPVIWGWECQGRGGAAVAWASVGSGGRGVWRVGAARGADDRN